MFPSHPSRFNHPKSIRWRIQTMKFCIIQVSPVLCYFISLRRRYFPEHFILRYSKYVSLRSVLRVRNQVDRTLDKTIAFYVLILRALCRTLEYIMFWKLHIKSDVHLSAASLEVQHRAMCCNQKKRRKRRVFWVNWRNLPNHAALMMVSQNTQYEWVR